MSRPQAGTLGVAAAAALSLAGIIACALTRTPVPETLTATATTAVGALAGLTLPSGPTPPDTSPQEASDGARPHP